MLAPQGSPPYIAPAMIARLFRTNSAKRPIDTARVPDGQRIYAIGDIHGRNDLLQQLLRQIDTDNAARGSAETMLIFLGDLMDRGPDSAGVIETTMALQRSGRNVRFLMGNHEETFIDACRKQDAELTRFFLRIGGEETVMSYPISRAEYLLMNMQDLSDYLPKLVPAEHLEFLESFEDCIVVGDYAFVHAGIRPGVPLAEQKKKDMRWIRDSFTSHRGDLEKVVIFGHTIYKDVEERGSRIGIDTGAYASNTLTAIGLEGGERWYLQT